MLKNTPKIPLISIEESSIPAHTLFNANEWENKSSKLIIHGCIAQYSIMNHSLTKLTELFENPDKILSSTLRTLNEQWQSARWDLTHFEYFVEAHTIHLHIQTYLIAAKTLLDIIIQLLKTESVIPDSIHAFHKGTYNGVLKTPGGKVLNSLDGQPNNDVAKKIKELILRNKEKWIDEIVDYRDKLTHPADELLPIMVKIDVVELENSLKIKSITKPRLNGTDEIDGYAKNTLKDIEIFCRDFTNLLKKPNSNLQD